MSHPRDAAAAAPVAQGWWHPSVKSGQVHDHSGKQPQAAHRLCEQVYLARAFDGPVARLLGEVAAAITPEHVQGAREWRPGIADHDLRDQRDWWLEHAAILIARVIAADERLAGEK